MRVVIFDIDGTLADCNHRLHHITGEKKDWDTFYAAVGGDTVVPAVRELAALVLLRMKVFLCSGRRESTRGATTKWLSDNDIHYHGLYMRKDGDHRPDTIIKGEMLDEIQRQHEVAFVVDDRPSVIAMWRERGLVCFACQDGERFREK